MEKMLILHCILYFLLRQLHCVESSEIPKFTTDVGESDFRVIRWCPGFVDKSLFLEELRLHRDAYPYVTAPAQFGKSSLLSMASVFFQAEYDVAQGELKQKNRFETEAFKMFKDLKINKEKPWFVKEHFQKYIVVHLNFESILGIRDYTSFKHEMCVVLKTMVEPFQFLLKCGNVSQDIQNFVRDFYDVEKQYCFNLFESLGLFGVPQQFFGLLQETFGKPLIVTGDNLDSHIQAVISRKIPDFTIISMKIQFFLGSIVKHLGSARIRAEKVYFTGVLHLGGFMSATCNTIQQKAFFSDRAIAKFHGLDKKEVMSLLTNHSMTTYYKTVEENFDGYAVLDSKSRLFCIPSVINYIKSQKVKPFTPRKMTTHTLLDGFEKVFSDYLVHSKVVRSLDTDKETNVSELLKIDASAGVHYKYILDIKEVAENNWSKQCFLAPYQVSDFFEYLICIGLYTVVKQNRYYSWIRPANKGTKKMLLEYLSNSGYANKRRDQSKSLKIDLEDAIYDLDSSTAYIERFGNATYRMLKGLPSNSESDYNSVVVSTFRSVVKRYPETFKFQPGLAIQITTENLQEKGKNRNETGEGKIDYIFVNMATDLVIILEFKEEGAHSTSSSLFIKRYFDALDTHPDYKYPKIDSKVYIGMSFTRGGTLSIKYVNNGSTIAETKIYK